MALHIDVQTTPFGSYTELDLTAEKISDLVIQVSYSHPRSATWIMHVANHEQPIAYRSFVRIWDDAGTAPNGSAWSSSLPIFEGFVELIEPLDKSFGVRYTAYDPTHRASNEVTVHSAAWNSGTVPTTPPTPASTSVPRLVFNASFLGGDEDIIWQRAAQYTVGDMVATLFQDAAYPLYWLNAVPDPASSWGYSQSDLLHWDFMPQEKVVVESEDVLSASRRMMSIESRCRLVWIPGQRVWRFVDIDSMSSDVLLTLNEFDEDNDILAFSISPSLEGRYGAVKIYGPETGVTQVFSTADGTLTPIGTWAVLQDCGSNDIRGYNTWQITNASQRKMTPTLPAPITVPMGSGASFTVQTPSLQLSWDGGTTWMAPAGVWFNYQTGVATMAPNYPYIYDSNGRVITNCIQYFFPPTTVRLIAGVYGTPLSVRYPGSGYGGTAATEAGFTNTLERYDESLAIGYVNGTPITTAFRLQQFQKLAQSIHEERRDIVYVGSVVLEGLEYEWAWLQRKVNLAGVDESGSGVPTGWETMKAWVTDVEYDFNLKTTTLTFSSDQMELIGIDVEQQKQRLKIFAMERRFDLNWWIHMGVYRRSTMFGTSYLAQWINAGYTITSHFVDPDTGFADYSQIISAG